MSKLITSQAKVWISEDSSDFGNLQTKLHIQKRKTILIFMPKNTFLTSSKNMWLYPPHLLTWPPLNLVKKCNKCHRLIGDIETEIKVPKFLSAMFKVRIFNIIMEVLFSTCTNNVFSWSFQTFWSLEPHWECTIIYNVRNEIC